jgi:hypothetical protein
MNEAAASSFREALNACMEAGCGRDIDAHGYAEPWTQEALAEQVGVDSRSIRHWLNAERSISVENFDELLIVMDPKDCPHQRAAYDRLKASRPAQPVTRKPRRPSAATPPKTLPDIPPDARPYRGLEAFREEDAHLFFGRDDLAQKVLGRLDHHRLVLLLGASGSGKSSLINAGILPKLRQDQGRRIVRCTPGDRAIANLAAALIRDLHPDLPESERLKARDDYQDRILRDPDAIRDIAQLLPKSRLLLVMDQFEETFTLTRPANPKQHDALIATLLAIAKAPDERKLEALLGMRSDFMNELETADPHLVQALDNASVQMRAMFPDELEDAIIDPLKPYGVTLEAGVFPAIAADLKGNPDALPLLEVALEELWQQRDEPKRHLTKAAYTEIGGITGALARRADRALELLGLDETTIRRLFLELVRVDPDGAATKSTRRPRTKTELDALDPDLWPLGRKLATPKIRLLVTRHDETNGDETLDITHESLFRQWQRLADWIEEERDFLIFRQRLDQRRAEFIANGENTDYLLLNSDVEKALWWQNERGKAFNSDQQDYIARSAANVAAQTLWRQLELSFIDDHGMPEHDRKALMELFGADGGTRRRFLVLATTDDVAARKLNQRPSLVLRACLRLDPTAAAELAVPVLASTRNNMTFQTALARVTLSRNFAALTKQHWGRAIGLYLDFAEKFLNATHLQRPALAIGTLAGKLDPDTTRDTAARILETAEQTTDVYNLQILVQIMAATADTLDAETGCEAERRIIARALHLAEQTTDAAHLRVMAQTIASTADKLDPATSRTADNRQAADRAVARAIRLAESNADAYQFLPLAEAIAALTDMLDPATSLKVASRMVALALELAGGTTDLHRLQHLTNAIAVLANKLNHETAIRTVAHAATIAETTIDSGQLLALAQVIDTVAHTLEPEMSRTAVRRTVEHILNLAENTTDRFRLKVLAQTIEPAAHRLDPETSRKAANRVVAHVLKLAEETTDSFQLKALAETIETLTHRLDPEQSREAAANIVARALYLVGQPIDFYRLRPLADTIDTLAHKLDPEMRCLAVGHTIARALDLVEIGEGILANCVQVVAALTDNFDAGTATRSVARALDLGETRAAILASVEIAAALANKVDAETATRAVAPALDLVGHAAQPYELHGPARAIAALANKLDPTYATDAAARIATRAVDLTPQATSGPALQSLAEVIAAVATYLDPAATHAAASHIVHQAMSFAEWASSEALQELAGMIATLAPLLPRPAAVLTAVELLKHPLGGDEGVTGILVHTITTALGRPDLRRPFPEESFWAVMQHLAEVKAANPDWEWLDLAREPLPPDELVATFRRLCASPPDWPAARQP